MIDNKLVSAVTPRTLLLQNLQLTGTGFPSPSPTATGNSGIERERELSGMLVELCKGERPPKVARGSHGDIAAMPDSAL